MVASPSNSCRKNHIKYRHHKKLQQQQQQLLLNKMVAFKLFVHRLLCGLTKRFSISTFVCDCVVFSFFFMMPLNNIFFFDRSVTVVYDKSIQLVELLCGNSKGKAMPKIRFEFFV